MTIATEALVISTIKYGDSSLIVKCLTASNGLKSYLLKGILTSRKGKLRTAYFQPLMQLDIIAIHKNQGTLDYIREVRVNYHYKTIHANPKKNAMVLFLSEMLNYALYEEEENINMFQYITQSLRWLDAHENTSNFHILFLLNLTKYLGFYPDNSRETYSFFDLQEGKFVTAPSLNPIAKDENIRLLKMFLGTDFDAVHTIKIKKEARQELLKMLILYFQLHLHSFKKLKSLPVLNDVFNYE